jgi:hypothetical protein
MLALDIADPVRSRVFTTPSARPVRSQICAVLNLEVTALRLLCPPGAGPLEGRTLLGTSDTEDRNVDPRDDPCKPATNMVQIREVIYANPRTLLRLASSDGISCPL